MSAPSAGGSELQVAHLARELARRGHEVTLVVPGLPFAEGVIDGVSLRSGWDPARGGRYVRAAYRYPHLYRVLRDERAQVYYTRGGAYFTPLVMRAARAVGAVSVLGLASDSDVHASSGRVLFGVRDARLSRVIGPIAHAAFRRWGLAAATWVAAQNDAQLAACRRAGLPSVILPNILVPPPADLAGLEPDGDVLWAGNVSDSRRSKGLAELAWVARTLPRVRFTVAGQLLGESHQETIEELGSMPNVEMCGPLTHELVLERIARSRLVLNTSPSEGFSNVMLEGWALGVPVVTLNVNPSGLLTDDRLGVCAHGDLIAMAAAITALLEEPRARAVMAARAAAYVREIHAPERVCAAFERLVSV